MATKRIVKPGLERGAERRTMNAQEGKTGGSRLTFLVQLVTLDQRSLLSCDKCSTVM